MRIAARLSFLAAVFFVFAGCQERAAKAEIGARHLAGMYPGQVQELIDSLRREAEFISSDINGPLKDEIARHVVFQLQNVGPLVFQTRDYAEKQIEQAKELPGIVTRHLAYQVSEKTEQLVREIAAFGVRNAKEELPRLNEEYRAFLRHNREQVYLFVDALKKYDRVNREMVDDLNISVGSFFRWQAETAKEIPDTTRRYVNKMTDDYNEIMNSTQRMFDHNLLEKPAMMKESVMRFAQLNADELVTELKNDTGEYFANNLKVSDLVREMHCFAEHNVGKTTELVDGVQRCLSLNGERAEALSREVFRFFEWRANQWADLKKEIDRYISVNVTNYREFSEEPMRYLERQREELEILKELVPRYFMYNSSKSEGLSRALRKYVDFNAGSSAGNR